MKLYRYLDHEELKLMLDNQIESLGRNFSENADGYKGDNTFKYDKEKKYIHFFKSKKSMLTLRSCIHDKLEKTYYFCEFDIPLKT